jgi:DNA polymerase III alpha subunit
MNLSILSDRLLRFDGKSIVDPDGIEDLLLLGLKPSQILTTELSEEVELFNQMSDDPILVYDENSPVELSYAWQIPMKYQKIDLVIYFAQFVTTENEQRINEELEIVQLMSIENEFRTIIYLIDQLREKEIVWGVGRGSACASYLLFCLGLHCVDSLKYNISLEEFYHF